MNVTPQDGEDLDEACANLWRWIQRGGFEPAWGKHVLAAGYYRCQAVQLQRAFD